jgi:hypothetical protein
MDRIREDIKTVRNKCSLLFYWVIGLGPFPPATFEGVNLSVSHSHQLLCHTGTCSFSGSGTIENDGFILEIFVRPGFKNFRIFPNSTFYFQVAICPIFAITDIDDDQIRTAHHGLEFFLWHSGGIRRLGIRHQPTNHKKND